MRYQFKKRHFSLLKSFKKSTKEKQKKKQKKHVSLRLHGKLWFRLPPFRLPTPYFIFAHFHEYGCLGTLGRFLNTRTLHP